MTPGLTTLKGTRLKKLGSSVAVDFRIQDEVSISNRLMVTVKF